MAKILFIALIAIVFVLLWKKSNAGTPRATTTSLIKKPLNTAQQAVFAQLQAALPATMVMVQPTVNQLIATTSAVAHDLVDFAICRKDSTPIGVIVIDHANTAALKQVIEQAGLKFAHFKSANLPNDQQMRDALGFL